MRTSIRGDHARPPACACQHIGWAPLGSTHVPSQPSGWHPLYAVWLQVACLCMRVLCINPVSGPEPAILVSVCLVAPT